MAQLTSQELDEMVRGQTITSRFAATVQQYPDAVALREKDGTGWHELTWTQYAQAACRVATGLAALGVTRGSRVGLFMRNRPEFHILDMAALLLGATPFSIYNSSAPDEVAYLVGHSHATVVVVEDTGYLAKVMAVREELPALEHVVVIESSALDAASAAPRGDALAPVAYAALLASAPVDFEAASKVAQPQDMVTIIYTSGTTGPPKGVLLDHASAVWTVECLRACLDFEPAGRRLVSYLPMAHVAERTNSHYQAVCLGYEVTTCPDPGQIPQYLAAVKPEIFFAVPRVWEKAYATMISLAPTEPMAAAALAAAIETGHRASEYRARGEDLPVDLAAEFEVADNTVLRGLRELLGLDQCLVAVSGAAPIPPTIFTFFRSLGVPLSEIYGLSETSGPMTWTPFRIKPGTVGPAVPGVEVRLADDGEVVCRGGNLFRGYLDEPEKTAEVLVDGWFYSGDIGTFDDDGYLKIIDRKKELIITAGGKNISPANIEAELKANPLVGQACVIGDQRPYLIALLVLDGEIAPGWAKQHGIVATSLAELAKNPVVLAEIQLGVNVTNAHFARVEQIKKFAVLSDEWLPDSKELTPTMKLKRRGILEEYADLIDSLYGS